MFDFRFNTPIPSLNQGQGRMFKVRECAQSIPRIKLPLRGHLLKKIFLNILSTLNPYFYWGQIDPCLNRLEILRFYLKNLAFLQFHINSPIDNESSLIEEPRSKRSSQTIKGIPRNSSLNIRGVKLTPV